MRLFSAESPHEEESADDSEVLQYLGVLHLVSHRITCKGGMSENSSEYGENDEHLHSETGAPVEEQHYTATKLEDDSENSENHSEALIGDATDKADCPVKIHEHPKTTYNEQESQKYSCHNWRPRRSYTRLQKHMSMY